MEGVNFQDPVLLDPLSGEIFEVKIDNKDGTSSIENIVLADYPMIVVEKRTVEYREH